MNMSVNPGNPPEKATTPTYENIATIIELFRVNNASSINIGIGTNNILADTVLSKALPTSDINNYFSINAGDNTFQFLNYGNVLAFDLKADIKSSGLWSTGARLELVEVYPDGKTETLAGTDSYGGQGLKFDLVSGITPIESYDVNGNPSNHFDSKFKLVLTSDINTEIKAGELSMIIELVGVKRVVV